MRSIESIGLQGVQSGLAKAAESAYKLSQSFQPESTSEPVDSIVALHQAKQQVEASAKIIKVGDQLNKSVLDILA